jgi:hypothetical protein
MGTVPPAKSEARIITMKNLRAPVEQGDDEFNSPGNEQIGPQRPKSGKPCRPPAGIPQSPAVSEEVVMLGLKA